MVISLISGNQWSGENAMSNKIQTICFEQSALENSSVAKIVQAQCPRGSSQVLFNLEGIIDISNEIAFEIFQEVARLKEARVEIRVWADANVVQEKLRLLSVQIRESFAETIHSFERQWVSQEVSEQMTQGAGGEGEVEIVETLPMQTIPVSPGKTVLMKTAEGSVPREEVLLIPTDEVNPQKFDPRNLETALDLQCDLTKLKEIHAKAEEIDPRDLETALDLQCDLTKQKEIYAKAEGSVLETAFDPIAAKDIKDKEELFKTIPPPISNVETVWEVKKPKSRD